MALLCDVQMRDHFSLNPLQLPLFARSNWSCLIFFHLIVIQKLYIQKHKNFIKQIIISKIRKDIEQNNLSLRKQKLWNLVNEEEMT